MATRCSTNPPLCLTARYTSDAFLSHPYPYRLYDYQVDTLPLLCHANPCNSIAISTQDSASRFRCYLCLAILCSSFAARNCPKQCLCFTSPTPHRPCVSVRGDSLLCHSISIHSGARPCRCFSGRIEATHFAAQPSRVTASQYFAFAVLRSAAQN